MRSHYGVDVRGTADVQLVVGQRGDGRAGRSQLRRKMVAKLATGAGDKPTGHRRGSA
jgi:hypothetical protein